MTQFICEQLNIVWLFSCSIIDDCVFGGSSQWVSVWSTDHIELVESLICDSLINYSAWYGVPICIILVSTTNYFCVWFLIDINIHETSFHIHGFQCLFNLEDLTCRHRCNLTHTHSISIQEDALWFPSIINTHIFLQSLLHNRWQWMSHFLASLMNLGCCKIFGALIV